MLMAHGFLKKIFEVFDKHETAIDMITTSEIAISLTIDNPVNLHKILDELEAYGEISVDTNHSIICVVGEGVINDKDTFRLFEILNDIPVRMISYGGSNNNISLLVDTKNKIQALQSLNRKLFEEKTYSKCKLSCFVYFVWKRSPVLRVIFLFRQFLLQPVFHLDVP